MYKIVPVTLKGLPNEAKISEIRCVQPLMKEFLESYKFEVHPESYVFKVPYIRYAIAQRVDFLAFKDRGKTREILIVECKGSPLAKRKVFGAVLQITMYMRLYRMLQFTPNPQLYLEGFDPLLVQKIGTLRGALAIPLGALTIEVSDALQQVYESLNKIDLIEPQLEIWSLHP